MAKRIDQPYQPGVRGWVKVKHRSTADCVVGGYRLAKGGDGVGSLLLGLHDDQGRLHYVGHTSSFRAAELQRSEKLSRRWKGAPPRRGRALAGAGRADGRWVARRNGCPSIPYSYARCRSIACRPDASGMRRRSCVGATIARPRRAPSYQVDASPPSGRPRRRFREGFTRVGSRSPLGKCGGHGASPSPPASSRAAKIQQPVEDAADGFTDFSPRALVHRSCAVARAPCLGAPKIVHGSTVATSSHVNGVDMRASSGIGPHSCTRSATMPIGARSGCSRGRRRGASSSTHEVALRGAREPPLDLTRERERGAAHLGEGPARLDSARSRGCPRPRLPLVFGNPTRSNSPRTSRAHSATSRTQAEVDVRHRVEVGPPVRPGARRRSNAPATG